MEWYQGRTRLLRNGQRRRQCRYGSYCAEGLCWKHCCCREHSFAERSGIMAEGPSRSPNHGTRISGGGFGSAMGPQFFENGTRTRLREIVLGYSLTGASFKQKTKLQSIDFSLTGRNIVLWATYKGIDPETNLTARLMDAVLTISTTQHPVILIYH